MLAHGGPVGTEVPQVAFGIARSVIPRPVIGVVQLREDRGTGRACLGAGVGWSAGAASGTQHDVVDVVRS